MKSVALVTYSKKPELLEGDNLLVEPFEKYGITPIAIPWDKKGVSWENFDLVILRSCWDYHTRIPEFISWLNTLENQKVNLWNPINIVRWNINKKYLLDLEKMGIPVIPTLLLNKKTAKNMEKRIAALGWKEVVIKPIYGASAYKIIKLKLQDLHHKILKFENIFQESELIIQPFIHNINIYGELSFIFINKKYSHAIIKKPQKNEFRSQIEFGGKELKTRPSYTLILQAQQVIEKIKSPLLYARVDGINNDGQLQLMELELIEPYLFFEKDRTSAEKFVQAAVELGR